MNQTMVFPFLTLDALFTRPTSSPTRFVMNSELLGGPLWLVSNRTYKQPATAAADRCVGPMMRRTQMQYTHHRRGHDLNGMK